MHAPSRLQRSAPGFTDDSLVHLQIRVAQRADELARVNPSGGSARRDRETWVRAEAELLPALTLANVASE